MLIYDMIGLVSLTLPSDVEEELRLIRLMPIVV
jgi:hypothetical protein